VGSGILVYFKLENRTWQQQILQTP